jgi:hypothetical protein
MKKSASCFSHHAFFLSSMKGRRTDGIEMQAGQYHAHNTTLRMCVPYDEVNKKNIFEYSI